MRMRLDYHVNDPLIKKIAEERFKRRLRSSRKRAAKRAQTTFEGHRFLEVISAPDIISLQSKGPRRALLNFLKRVRYSVLIRRNPVMLNFTDTFFLTAPGTVLMTAELDRMKRQIVVGDFNVRIRWSEDPVVNQVLHQVGIAGLCGQELDGNNESVFDESVRHWRYATGVQMNDIAGRALDRFEGRIAENLHSGLWKGVSEAVVNSVEHAYLEPRFADERTPDETRWWMFSQVRDQLLTVVVCDLGIGIPRSLPIRWGLNELRDILKRFGLHKPDLAAIRGALELGATRTGKGNRGKGLPQIWQDLKAEGAKAIFIFSNRAVVEWNPDKGGERSHEFDGSIGGTIICWTVALNEKSP